MQNANAIYFTTINTQYAFIYFWEFIISLLYHCKMSIINTISWLESYLFKSSNVKVSSFYNNLAHSFIVLKIY